MASTAVATCNVCTWLRRRLWQLLPSTSTHTSATLSARVRMMQELRWVVSLVATLASECADNAAALALPLPSERPRTSQSQLIEPPAPVAATDKSGSLVSMLLQLLRPPELHRSTEEARLSALVLPSATALHDVSSDVGGSSELMAVTTMTVRREVLLALGALAGALDAVRRAASHAGGVSLLVQMLRSLSTGPVVADARTRAACCLAVAAVARGTITNQASLIEAGVTAAVRRCARAAPPLPPDLQAAAVAALASLQPATRAHPDLCELCSSLFHS
jgi:hypothetical protein